MDKPEVAKPGFDEDLAYYVSKAEEQRNHALGDIGKAVLAQLSRLGGGLVRFPSEASFRGEGHPQYGRSLEAFEIVGETGDAYVEEIDEPGEVWERAEACWKAVIELASFRHDFPHSFSVDLRTGVVELGHKSMSLNDPLS
jgi:hypothetical protein